MKPALILLAANLTSLACAVGAILLALNGIAGWGVVSCDRLNDYFLFQFQQLNLMKEFIDSYIIVPFAILLMCFLAPVVTTSGLLFAGHIFGIFQQTGFCENVKK